MGKREQVFGKLLSRYSSKFDDDFVVPRPTIDDMRKFGVYEEVVSVYKRLGGTLDIPPCNIPRRGFAVDRKIIRLDGADHFNRYRAMTLEADVYRHHKYFKVRNHKKYCLTREDKCRTYGGYWSNPSCKKQFGKANETGNLDGNGSPRWKQRAFYDFIKDLIPTIFDIPLLRIAIYDELTDDHGKSRSVNEILKNEDFEQFALICDRNRIRS